MDDENDSVSSDIFKSYSRCRLCLDSITKYEQSSRLDDSVAVSTTKNRVPLYSVLSKISKIELCNNITGFDTICKNCIGKSLYTYNFIHQYEMATQNILLIKNCDSSDQDSHLISDKNKKNLFFVQKEFLKPITKFLFKCSCCKEDFNDLQALVENNRDSGLLTCEKCMHTSKHKDVSKHEISATLYKCDICSQFRSTEESLEEHKVRTHCLHICYECGKSCKGMDKLLEHEQKHPVKNYCLKCGQTYTTLKSFEKHEPCLEDCFEPHPTSSHIKKKPYACFLCEKSYSSEGGLQVHQKFVHGNAKYHDCNECGKKFTFPCYLKAHMVTHTKEKIFPCNLCQKRLASKNTLYYHMRRHTGEKPYRCHLCEKKYVSASARKQHIKFKHNPRY